MKLEPIVRTPRKEEKLIKAEMLKLDIFSARGKMMEANTCRLRR